MSGASDKARFYLEQSVPELREWERKEIFRIVRTAAQTACLYLMSIKDEIKAIASKRSDFEHLLNARGSQPADYARYAEYEMNVDSLRRKRVKRLGIKVTAHNGQRRIFHILDRATRKFHGDVGLWLQYADYARAQKSNKKLTRILTDMLRLHPTRPELWIYAARYSIDVQADFSAARTYMQRVLRFNKTSKAIYLEYAKLEMTYIAKISARRQILGLDQSKKQVVQAEQPEEDSGTISLTAGLTEDDDEQDRMDVGAIDGKLLNRLSTTSALAGAIPLAIFDAAMRQFPGDDVLLEQFFNSFAEFVVVASLHAILEHVLKGAPLVVTSTSPYIQSCMCRMPLVGIPIDSPEFPAALRTSLQRIKDASSSLGGRQSELNGSLKTWLEPLSQHEKLAPELQRVITATLRRLEG